MARIIYQKPLGQHWGRLGDNVRIYRLDPTLRILRLPNGQVSIPRKAVGADQDNDLAPLQKELGSTSMDRIPSERPS